jgi:hypothetical protein
MRGLALNWRLPVKGIQWAASQSASVQGAAAVMRSATVSGASRRRNPGVIRTPTRGQRSMKIANDRAPTS